MTTNESAPDPTAGEREHNANGDEHLPVSTATPPADDASEPNIVQRIVNAWDCCGTCAGGVLASYMRDREAAAATKARADERERTDATWALHTPSVWESPDERSIPALLAGIGQVLERIARGDA